MQWLVVMRLSQSCSLHTRKKKDVDAINIGYRTQVPCKSVAVNAERHCVCIEAALEGPVQRTASVNCAPGLVCSDSGLCVLCKVTYMNYAMIEIQAVVSGSAGRASFRDVVCEHRMCNLCTPYGRAVRTTRGAYVAIFSNS